MSLMYCAVCKQKIAPGPYTMQKGKNYHIECYKEHMLPRCSVCAGIIEGGYVAHNGKNYHKSCFDAHAALKCSLCGKIINGVYTKDYWGNLYHEEHGKHIPACDYCMRLIDKRITGGGTAYRDGRHICRLCLASAVNNRQEAEKLYNRAKTELTQWGIEVNYKHPVSLVTGSELARISGKKINTDHQGFTRREAKFVDDKLVAHKIEVFMLEGLPAVHFFSTAAHELMHVWQYLYAKPQLPQDITEGSCNYAAYLVLTRERTPDAEYIINTMLKSRERIYGRGFRKIYDLVRKKSIQYWLQYLKQGKE